MTDERFVPPSLEDETGDVVACGVSSTAASEAWWDERSHNVLWFADVLLDRMLAFARARGLPRLGSIDSQGRARFDHEKATELAAELAIVERECGDPYVSECARRITTRVEELLAGPATTELNIEGP